MSTFAAWRSKQILLLSLPFMSFLTPMLSMMRCMALILVLLLGVRGRTLVLRQTLWLVVRHFWILSLHRARSPLLPKMTSLPLQMRWLGLVASPVLRRFSDLLPLLHLLGGAATTTTATVRASRTTSGYPFYPCRLSWPTLFGTWCQRGSVRLLSWCNRVVKTRLCNNSILWWTMWWTSNYLCVLDDCKLDTYAYLLYHDCVSITWYCDGAMLF
jgi:hypothetical protein